MMIDTKSILYLLILLFNTTTCDTPQPVLQKSDVSPSDLVYPHLDSANSRWFYFASACRPFGMVTLNPDTQVGGAWGSGYRYETDTIKGFSHIHGWQISGVSVMPITFKDEPTDIMDNYFSPFSHDREIAQVGYHKVELERYDITARMTSTHRVGFHHYTFSNGDNKGILFQLSGKLGPSEMIDGKLVQMDSRTLHGEITNAPTRRRPKNFKVFYVVKLDADIGEVIMNGKKNALIKFSQNPTEVKMKVGISYTSHENAMHNINEELAHWDFDNVVGDSKKEWDQLLGRIEVKDGDSIQVRRFYTDLWHGLQGRRTISDVNGAYPDNTGEEFKIGQLPLDENGKPKFRHFNSDSFWGAQWTLNTLWGLIYPGIYSEFVHSLMQYYRDGGLVPRGPSGGNYTYVMTGASSTPFIVSAFQKGINIGDPEEVYNALKKNHMSKGIMSKAGYEHYTYLGGGLDYYLEKHYVPYPIPEGKFGYHQDGASLTLEYAYQDFTLAQMAKSLSKEEDYRYFMQRSGNYKNVFDASSGWVRPKNLEGEWKDPFDPYQYENGFNESNGVQSTWFVGHDINGLATLMGGAEKAVEKLNKQFETAAKTNFTAGSSHERGENPELARVPINYGNQPSIQTAYIFHALGRPDLTQHWSSEVIDKTFSGLSPFTGYSGDEDQGLMGSLAVIMKLGLFQLNGGTEADPIYFISSPLFDSVSIKLSDGKELFISKQGLGTYIDQVFINGVELPDLTIKHSTLMAGGNLLFKMKRQ